MCLGKPDVQRKHTCFCSESQENENTCCQDLRLRRASRCRTCAAEHLRQSFKGQRTGRIIEQDQAHKKHKPADHSDEQIRISGADGIPGLLVNDPGKRSKGKDLKKDKCGHQVRGEHDAFYRAQRKQDEKPVAAYIFPLMKEILQRKHGCPQPHDGCDHRIYSPESDQREGQSARKDSGDRKTDGCTRRVRLLACHKGGSTDGTARCHNGQGQHKSRHENSRGIPGFFIPLSYDGRDRGSYKWSEDDQCDLHAHLHRLIRLILTGVPRRSPLVLRGSVPGIPRI